MVVAFSPEDDDKLTPQKAIAITRQALQKVASGNRPTSEKEKNMNDLLELAAELLATLYNVKLRQSKRDISNNQKLIDTATETDLKPTNFTP